MAPQDRSILDRTIRGTAGHTIRGTADRCTQELAGPSIPGLTLPAVMEEPDITARETAEIPRRRIWRMPDRLDRMIRTITEDLDRLIL